MENIDSENFNKTADPVLLEQEQQGHALPVEVSLIEKRPERFTKIKKTIIKMVSLYLQLLWDENSNGKTIDIKEVINNSQTLFGAKYESKDIFTLRHIASDLREIICFLGLTSSLKKCFKNIDINRQDILLRIKLSDEIYSFFSKVIHFNYINSHEVAKEISKIVNNLDKENLDVPNEFKDYFEKRKFEDIFENICIIFIFNYFIIFSEYLYDDKV